MPPRPQAEPVRGEQFRSLGCVIRDAVGGALPMLALGGLVAFLVVKGAAASRG